MVNSTQVLGMGCPKGGQFYACNGKDSGANFLGCCLSNPCDQNGCPAGHLVPTSLDPSYSGPLPDQECDAGLFYGCKGANPFFWGCCKVNPCSPVGCADDQLAGAFLSDNPAQTSIYITNPSTTSNTSKTSAPSASSPSAREHHSISVGLIIGACVGVFFLALFCSLAVWHICHRRSKGRSISSQRSLISDTIQKSLYTPNSKSDMEDSSSRLSSPLTAPATIPSPYISESSYQSGSPTFLGSRAGSHDRDSHVLLDPYVHDMNLRSPDFRVSYSGSTIPDSRTVIPDREPLGIIAELPATSSPRSSHQEASYPPRLEPAPQETDRISNQLYRPYRPLQIATSPRA